MEIPFFFLRLSILCVYQNITRVVFLLKNFAFVSIFIYFWVVRPNVFESKPPRQIAVKTVESTVPNRNAQHFQEHSNPEYDNRSRADTFDDFHDEYGSQDNGNYYSNDNVHSEQYQEATHYHDDHSQFQQPPPPLQHKESNGIKVHYNLQDNYNSYQNPGFPSSQIEIDYQPHDNSYHPEDNHQISNSELHEGPVGPHHVRRLTRKSFRKSIIKSNVFSPPTVGVLKSAINPVNSQSNEK